MTDAHDRTGQDEYQLAAVRAAGDAIVSKASDGVVTSWNPAAERIFGWSAAEAVGCHVSFLIPPDRLDEWTGLMDRVRGGERIEQFETVRVRKDGARIDVAVTIAPIYDRDGRLVGISKVARDVTEHRRLVAERDEAHRQLLLQIERMPLAYVLCAPDLRCVRWNPAAERLFGYPADEMLGRNPFDVLTPPQSRGLVADTLRRLRAGDMDAHGVWDVVTRDRRTATCEWHNTPLTGDDGAFRGVFSLAEDLTERRSLEDRYRHAQKMEAVGQLAGGVAHDFNNLLTVINGYADLLLRDLSPGDPRRGLVEEIHGAGVRSASLTRQLLAFSRKQVVAPRPLDLNAVVADTQKLLARVIGEDVRLHLSLDPGLGTVEADPGQVEQVLLNLAINARDAMPTGGQLTIETRDVELDGAPVRAEVRPGRHALLAVSDTGCGMTPEVRARVFEPFFTTKGPGKGTGLGLAVVHGIAHQAGGGVEVYSEPGVGTTFKVYLPTTGRSPRADRPASHLRVPPRGTETVLLAEDEGAVRALTRHVLAGCGYAVLEAADGEEAARVAERHAGRIDLLVTDVVMPGIGGRAVAARVAGLHPGAKVLYLSGYTDDAIVRHGVLHEDAHFLQKPFSPYALAHKVREVLDGG